MIALIVAHTKNRTIGLQGRIPWDIDGEKQRFKELTTNNIIIMGKNSYLEIGRPLPNRINIIVSSSLKQEANDIVNQYDNIHIVSTLTEALELAKKQYPDKNVYLSGGQAIYEEGLELCEKLYVTEIDAYIAGDKFFPEFNKENYIREVEKEVEQTEDNPGYTYVTYTKKEQHNIH